MTKREEVIRAWLKYAMGVTTDEEQMDAIVKDFIWHLDNEYVVTDHPGHRPPE